MGTLGGNRLPFPASIVRDLQELVGTYAEEPLQLTRYAIGARVAGLCDFVVGTHMDAGMTKTVQDALATLREEVATNSRSDQGRSWSKEIGQPLLVLYADLAGRHFDSVAPDSLPYGPGTGKPVC